MRALVIATVVLSHAACWGQEPKRGVRKQMAADAPTPPTQEVLSFPSDTKWRLKRQVVKTVNQVMSRELVQKIPVKVRKLVVIDGKEVEREFTEYRTETRTVAYTVNRPVIEISFTDIDPRTWRVFDIRGGVMSPQEVLKRCESRETLVVVSGTEQMIDASYAALFKAATIVLVPASNPAVVTPAAPEPAPTGTAASGPSIKLPAQPEPNFVHASTSGSGIKLRQVSRYDRTAEVGIVEEGAAGELKSVKVEQAVVQSTTTTIPAKLVRLLAAKPEKDRPQTPETALGDRERLVLLSADGRDVDPFWLQNLEPSVVVLSGVFLPPEPQSSSAKTIGSSAIDEDAFPPPSATSPPLPFEAASPVRKNPGKRKTKQGRTP